MLTNCLDFRIYIPDVEGNILSGKKEKNEAQ
jgi:hypothetical protein